MFHFILNNSKDMVCWKMYNFLGPPATLYFTLLHRPDNGIIVMTVSVCLSVCVSAATSPELHAPYSPYFMCTSPTYDVHNVTLLIHLMNLMIMGTFKNSHICKKHVHQMKWALLGRFPTHWIHWSCRFGGNVFRLCAQDECNSWLFPGPVCRWSESRVV